MSDAPQPGMFTPDIAPPRRCRADSAHERGMLVFRPPLGWLCRRHAQQWDAEREQDRR